MKKITTIILVGIVCGAVWGQTNKIELTGNVGIGTTSPSARLTTIQNGTIGGENLANAGLLVGTTSNGIGIDNNEIVKKGDGGLNFQSIDTPINFFTGNETSSFRMTILPNGYVGIGTLTPVEVLDVKGKANFYSSASDQIWGISIKSNAVNTGEYTGIKLLNGYSSETNKWAGIAATAESAASNRTGLALYTGESTITEKVRVDYSGRVGIGTTTPNAKLDVQGSIKGSSIILDNPNTTDDWNTIWQSGCFEGYRKANAPESEGWFWGMNLGHSSNTINYRYGGQIAIKNSSSNPTMYFRSRGQDGTGTWAKILHSVGDQKINGNLTVDGILNSEEVNVELIAANNITYTANGNTADFVFEDKYQLKDLTEVEAFIKANKHLPDIPSADEMEEAGVNLAEMNKLLLMKVEELTLYVIEQEKEKQLLKTNMAVQEESINAMKEELELIKEFIKNNQTNYEM